MFAAQVHRGEVDPLHALPRLEPGVEDGVVVGRADAGVVAADVDAAVAGGHLAVQRLDLVRGGDVGPHEHAADRRGHRTAGVLVEVDHRHLRALGREALAHGAADAAGAAGDDATVLEPAGVVTGVGRVAPALALRSLVSAAPLYARRVPTPS